MSARAGLSESDLQLLVEGNATCFLGVDGMVTCIGPLDTFPVDQDPPPPGTYTMLTVGSDHACAVDTASGEMVCWGNSPNGEADPPLLADLALPKETG